MKEHAGAKFTQGIEKCNGLAEKLLKCANLPLPGILKSVFF
jgi:hypothetical protein